jgi:hypothetical protein
MARRAARPTHIRRRCAATIRSRRGRRASRQCGGRGDLSSRGRIAEQAPAAESAGVRQRVPRTADASGPYRGISDLAAVTGKGAAAANASS